MDNLPKRVTILYEGLINQDFDEGVRQYMDNLGYELDHSGYFTMDGGERDLIFYRKPSAPPKRPIETFFGSVNPGDMEEFFMDDPAQDYD